MMDTPITYQVLAGCCLCEACLLVCPVGAIVMDAGGARIQETLCLGCGRCAGCCPFGAIVAQRSRSGKTG